MRKTIRLITAVTAFAMLLLTACGDNTGESSSSSSAATERSKTTVSDTDVSATTDTTTKQNEEKKAEGMGMTVGDKRFTIIPEENDSAAAFCKLLPVTLEMSELNGNEKYYYLDKALPSAPEKVGRINAGDVMLYGDKCIVVFYKSFDTSYTYTRLGHMEDTNGLEKALGDGDVKVTFDRS